MGDMVLDAAEPDGAPRIASLDVLRGIAILGILFMNINSMGASLAASHSPLPNLIGWTPLDRLFWWARELFAQGTARCLLEMLFGAGMVILTGRLAAGRSSWRIARRYYWRNAVLFAFGIAHVFLLMWPGDVLHVYALSAMIVFPLRRLSPRWLLALGLSYALFGAGLQTFYLHRADSDNGLIAQAAIDRAAGRAPTAEEAKSIKRLDRWHQRLVDTRAAAAKEASVRPSGFAKRRSALVDDYTGRLRDWFGPLMVLWEAAATMLIGAALFKAGFLGMARRPAAYASLAVAGYAVGLVIRGVGAWHTTSFDDSITYAWGFEEFGRLAMTVGHVGLIGWMLTSSHGVRLLRPFVAAGRTALSLYILQTLICLWLLYPPFGLGLYGKQGWMSLMLTALAVDAGLLLLANWWVGRFAIAPVEWAWRSIVARRRLPFARPRPAGGGASPLPA